MTKVEQRRLERIAILRMLLTYGPQTAAVLRDRVNSECDHDALEGLPLIGSRAMGPKLSEMWWQGLVRSDMEAPAVWSITDEGELMAVREHGPVEVRGV